MAKAAIKGKDPVTGQFVQGNKTWTARSSHGRNPIFKSADDLLKACQEYFQWAEDHPLYENKAFAYEGVVTIEKVAKPRAMTIDGLTLFLDIDVTTWRDWRMHTDFSPVVKAVDKAIREQKFSGAAANIFNANIIARDLGLAEKTETTGANGGPIQTVNFNLDVNNMPAEALDNLEKALMAMEGNSTEENDDE